MLVPPPDKLPLPLAQVSVVLPWTAVFVPEPYNTAKLVEPPSTVLPPPERPLPAVIVIEEFCSALFANVVVPAAVNRPWASTVKVGTRLLLP